MALHLLSSTILPVYRFCVNILILYQDDDTIRTHRGVGERLGSVEKQVARRERTMAIAGILVTDDDSMDAATDVLNELEESVECPECRDDGLKVLRYACG